MVILDHFEESDQPEVNGECCDVCVKSDSAKMVECKEEMVAIMRAVMDNPNKGEKKVTFYITLTNKNLILMWPIPQIAEWLRGYCRNEECDGSESTSLLELAPTFTCLKLLGEFASDKPGSQAFWTGACISATVKDKSPTWFSNPAPVKHTTKSKGTHLLPTVTKLLSSSENWFEIKDPDDYQYPGRFNPAHPERLGFAPDITTLPFYVKDDEHFLFNDIQISKGKPRAPRKVTVTVDKKEEVYYRIAPCGGVKCCPIADCSYTTSIKEQRPCPDHTDPQLTAVHDCPVEFVYVWSVNDEDKRRWLSGIVRRGDLSPNNFAQSLPSWSNQSTFKVVHDIQKALEIDPTLKTHDIVTGQET